jgi:probable HAF family extracellular repeat protein
MRLNQLAHTFVVALLTTMATSTSLAAPEEEAKHHHYKLIDMGTFGGPHGGISNPSTAALNRRGALVDNSDTAMTDPFSPNCFLDCYVDQSGVWQNGVLTPLSSLPGGESNFAPAINARGQIVGTSQNGAVDPLTGWPEADAVLWQEGVIINLGTLGGSQSIANAVNDKGQVVGAALNATSDPFASNPLLSCVLYPPAGGCFSFAQTFLFTAPATTETHAFVWTKAQGMQDLGTLGGPDSSAWIINDRGQIAGESFTSFTPNPSSGVPTIDPFFWDPREKEMIDLGSLGGTFGATVFMNRRGQVVGVSNPPGDVTEHPFIWSKSRGMQDLGTLGGSFGHPDWVNDAGEVVGFAKVAGDQDGHAFLWRHGVMTDLGTIGTDPDSESTSINSLGQVVGASFSLAQGVDLHGFLREHGGPLVDLNTLVLPGTTMFVTSALVINDGGEIGCLGALSNGDGHACVLIPCDENHPGVEGCDYALVDAATAAQVRAPQAAQSSPAANENHDRPMGLRDRLDRRLIHWRGLPGVRSPNKLGVAK